MYSVIHGMRRRIRIRYFMVDPEEDLILVFLQHVAEGPDWILRNKYRQIVYSSLED